MTPPLTPLRLLIVTLLACGPGGDAIGDELRMADGEILYGRVQSRQGGWIWFRTDAGRRRIARSQVAEIVEGVDPAEHLRAAGASRDPGELEELAWFAWRHRLDEEARDLAARSIEIDPDRTGARSLLGFVGTDEGWEKGWLGPAGAGPRWGQAREDAWKNDRDRRKIDRSIGMALDWLATHQDDDGRIDADAFMKHDPESDRCDGAGGGHHGERVPCSFDLPTTAVATMAWVAGGSTPVSGPYRENVAAAVGFLSEALEARRASIWDRAYGVQALAEVCRVWRDRDLRATLVQAVETLLQRQQADGGWTYLAGRGDVPTTSAAAVGVGLASRAGIPIPREKVVAIVRFLDERIDPSTGRSEYHLGAERKGYTPTTANAAGDLASRAMLETIDSSPHLQAQIETLVRREPEWEVRYEDVTTPDGRTVRAYTGSTYLYRWAYTAPALHRAGGDRWKTWYTAAQRALRKGQRVRGSARGSWDPVGPYSTSAGRAFATALGALILLEPCRFPAAE